MENYSKGLKFLDHYLILALKLNFNILSRKNKENHRPSHSICLMKNY